MKMKSETYKEQFFAGHPRKLGAMINSKLQHVEFYEHPTHGDEDSVYGLIDGTLFDTGFHDLDDMICPNSDYEPIKIGDEIRYGYELQGI